MAKMIPGRPPQGGGITTSEVEVWEALMDGLDDDFYVYHSLPFLRKDGYQEEVDFLILHRRWGVLNLECKGWGVEWENGKWFRLGPAGTKERLKKTPMEQARGQISGVIDKFSAPLRRAGIHWADRHEFPVVCAWGLIFPKTKIREQDLPTTLEPEVVLDSEVMRGDLQEAIEDIYRYHGQKLQPKDMVLTEEEFRVFREVFCPEGKIEREALAASIFREREKQIQLSKRQREAARWVVANQRVSVRGGAGTGQTVLALYCAEALVKEGERVLLTCFNRDLAYHLRQSEERCASEEGEIVVRHFHDLCAQAIETLDGRYEFPSGSATKEERKHFWQEESAMALMEAIAEGVFEHGPFDSILVDEGQDFRGLWWEVLELLLKDGDEARLVVFHDKEQAIFGREPSIPELDMDVPLETNFRNTQAIAEVVDQLSDVRVKSSAEAPEGEAPTVIQQKGPSWTGRKIKALVERLLEEQKLEPEQVVVLTPHSKGNSSMKGVDRIGVWPVVDGVKEWEAGEGVLHATVSGFKGLEADVVVLADVDPEDERCSRNWRYVAASRAKHRLFVLEKGHWLSD